MEEQVAVYIDFENIAISAEEVYGRFDLSVILSAADRYGRCVIKRAYGDWTRFSRYRPDLIEFAIDLTQLYRYGSYSKKNSADIIMAVDALEAALLRPAIDTFVLVTGDSDFSAVARRIRSYGKRVVGVGLRDATSEVLVRSCDAFVIYDELVEGEETTSAYDLEHARQLLITVMHQLTPRYEDGRIPASILKHEMLRLQSDFDETALGFRQFQHFLESQRDLISTRATPNGHVAWLRSTLVAKSEIDKTLEYRTALNTAGFRLVEQSARREILQNLYRRLQEAPGQYTWRDLVLQVKEGYDADNILRSRDEIQDVARLLKHAAVFEPQPQSWELDPLMLKCDLTVQDFTLQCESVYVTVLLEKNLEVHEALLATLLYGSPEATETVRTLQERAQANRPEVVHPADLRNGYEWPRHIAESPELEIVLRDLLNWRLDEEPSMETAMRLNNQGLRIRTTDFERARVYFIKAAKMMYELLKQKRPGASLMDLEWYLASYCAATAGAHFSRHSYPRAIPYYLAFFALVKETEPVWDKVRKLVPPMLSFYFTIAPNEHSDLLKVSPGRTHPARLAVLLHNHRSEGVRRRWLEMVRELVRINPPLLRGIIQRLAFLEEEDQLAGARETRRTLTRLINNEPVLDVKRKT